MKFDDVRFKSFNSRVREGRDAILTDDPNAALVSTHASARDATDEMIS